MAMKDDVPAGFDKPVDLPINNDQGRRWQDENRTWWENHPMRYDWKEEIGFEEFSRDFYLEIDHRSFSNLKQYMPWEKMPFDPLIDFDDLQERYVLEIGVGNGSHAQLLAKYAKSYTGIDITDYAVKSTSERMKCFQINAKVIRMDAEEMLFDDNTFDFIWAWGVIHHSSNTKKTLREMHRVLRPGGMAVTMVYHRNFWNYYVIRGVFRGIIQGDLLKTKSLHRTAQRYTDGAIARFYTIPEWQSLVSEYFDVRDIQIYGTKGQLVPLPGGRIKNRVMVLIPNSLSRFLTNRCKLGSFLVSILEKK